MPSVLLLPPPVQQLLSFTPPVVSLPPSTGASRPMTGLIGKRNLQPRNWVTGNTAFTYRIRYPVTRTATGIQMEFPAWSTVTAGVGDEGAGNIITLAAVYCEYAGTLYPVTFNGSSSVAIGSGLTQKSDVVAGLTVAAGTTLFIRTALTVPSGGRYPGLYGSFTYPDELGAPGNLANATGDLAGATGNTNVAVYGPVQVWGTYGLGQAFNSITVCGDSIAAGTNDSFANEADTGYYQRALWPGDRPFSIVALPGENGQQLLTQGNNRADIVGEFCDYVIFEYGINDLQSGASLAQLQARSFANTVIARNLWVDGVWQQTLGPKTASTDAWATTTNQTPDSINTARVQFNDWVRDGMPELGGVAVATGTPDALRAGQGGHPFRGYIEVADLCETSRNSGIWHPSYTSDGLHPNTTGNAAIAAALDLSQFVDTFPTTAPPQVLVHDASSFPLTSSAFQGSAASQAYTSPAFSPPAGSVIVIGAQAVQSFNNAWNLPTITDSLATHLTWTRVTQQADVSTGASDGTAALFWASCPTAQTGMTVTVTQSLAGSGQTITFSSLVGDVWTNADTTTPIPASFVKGTSTSAALSVSFTPTGSSSASMILANNAAASSGVTAAGTGAYLVGETHNGPSFVDAWFGNAAGPTVPAGAQNLALTGAASPRWQYIAYEVASAAAAAIPATIAVPAGQLSIAATGPAFGIGASVTVPAGTAVVDGTPATVTGAATVGAPAGALSVAGTAPAVLTGTGATVAVPAAQAALSGTAPAVLTGTGATIAVPAGAITLNGTTPAVLTGTGATVTVPAGQATITSTAAAVSGATSVGVPAGAVSVTGTAPAVLTGTGVTLAIPAGQVTINATTPTATGGLGASIAVTAGQATVVGTGPAVTAAATVGAPAGALSFAGTAPVVGAGGGANVAVPVGQAALSGTAPTVASAVSVNVPAGQLTAVATPPAVTTGAGAAIAIPAGRVTITGAAPAIVIGDGFTAAVPAGLVTLAGTAPAVTSAANVGAPAGRITLTGTPPLIDITGSGSITVPAGLITLTGTAPTVTSSANVGAPAGRITLTGTPPLIDITGAGTSITVPAGRTSLAGTAPAVAAAATITTPAGRLAVAGRAPLVVAGAGPVQRDLDVTLRLHAPRYRLEMNRRPPGVT